MNLWKWLKKLLTNLFFAAVIWQLVEINRYSCAAGLAMLIVLNSIDWLQYHIEEKP